MQENPLIGDRNNEYQKASLFLSNLDSDWEALITKVGKCNLKLSYELKPYQALIKSVIFQQLHPAAGNAIFKRFLLSFNNQFPKDQQILDSPSSQLKQCGLSQNKLNTIIEIAKNSTDGDFPNIHQFNKMNEIEIISTLTSIKGIGEWTAQMLMIFNLGFFNIMPAKDLAIRKNYQALKCLKDSISPKEILTISKLWHPYKSIASWYLWKMN